jgi:hypothetical protein
MVITIRIFRKRQPRPIEVSPTPRSLLIGRGGTPPSYEWQVSADPEMSNDEKRTLFSINARMRRDHHPMFDG